MSFFISNLTTNTIVDEIPFFIEIIAIILVLVFYNIIIYPQQKRAKLNKVLIKSISKGDEIQTNSGLIGRVVKVTETGYIFIALNETNEVVIKREFIAIILPKGTIKAL